MNFEDEKRKPFTFHIVPFTLYRLPCTIYLVPFTIHNKKSSNKKLNFKYGLKRN